MQPILQAEGVSKKFRIHNFNGGYLSFRERIQGLFSFNNHEEDFWALQDLSFSVQPAESIGIIGRNGAGKSTLLKILSKITPPTKGRIILRGRIASLLEVGTGFHPELTGRENIFFNGSLLGMKRKEIDSKFDEIVDFSGTEKFLDTALKYYSSGMQLRLAFSVAAFLEPEVLIIDEVLAVGDAEFQKKCLGKMNDVSKSGRTIIFVSHNLAAVENLCRRAIVLDKGKMTFNGDVQTGIQKYQQSFNDSIDGAWHLTKSSGSNPYLKKATATLSGSQPRQKLTVMTEIISVAPSKDGFLAFDISNSMGITICQAIPNLKPFVGRIPGIHILETEIDLPPLIPDNYKVSIWLGSHNTETIFWEKEILGFEITNSPMEGRNFPHSHNNGFLVPQSRIIHG